MLGKESAFSCVGERAEPCMLPRVGSSSSTALTHSNAVDAIWRAKGSLRHPSSSKEGQ
jgi:hypothetical protein